MSGRKRGRPRKDTSLEELATMYNLGYAPDHCNCADVKSSCHSFGSTGINPWSGRVLIAGKPRFKQVMNYCDRILKIPPGEEQPAPARRVRVPRAPPVPSVRVRVPRAPMGSIIDEPEWMDQPHPAQRLQQRATTPTLPVPTGKVMVRVRVPRSPQVPIAQPTQEIEQATAPPIIPPLSSAEQRAMAPALPFITPQWAESRGERITRGNLIVPQQHQLSSAERQRQAVMERYKKMTTRIVEERKQRLGALRKILKEPSKQKPPPQPEISMVTQNALETNDANTVATAEAIVNSKAPTAAIVALVNETIGQQKQLEHALSVNIQVAEELTHTKAALDTMANAIDNGTVPATTENLVALARARSDSERKSQENNEASRNVELKTATVEHSQMLVNAIVSSDSGPIPTPIQTSIQKSNRLTKSIEKTTVMLENVEPFTSIEKSYKTGTRGSIPYTLSVKPSTVSRGRGLFLAKCGKGGKAAFPKGTTLCTYKVSKDGKATFGFGLVSLKDMESRGQPTSFGIRIDEGNYADFLNPDDANNPEILKTPGLIGLHARPGPLSKVNAQLLTALARSGVYTMTLESTKPIIFEQEIVVQEYDASSSRAGRHASPEKVVGVISQEEMDEIDKRSQMQSVPPVTRRSLDSLPQYKDNSCHLDTFIAAIYASKMHQYNLFDFIHGSMSDGDTPRFVSNNGIASPNVLQDRYVVLDELIYSISNGNIDSRGSSLVRDQLRVALVGDKAMNRMGNPNDWAVNKDWGFSMLFEMIYYSFGSCTNRESSHGEQTVESSLFSFSGMEHDLDVWTILENQISDANIRPTCKQLVESKPCNSALEKTVTYVHHRPRIIILNAFASEVHPFTIPRMERMDQYQRIFDYPTKPNSDGKSASTSIKYRMTGIALREHDHWTIHLNVGERWVLYNDVRGMDYKTYNEMRGTIIFFTAIAL